MTDAPPIRIGRDPEVTRRMIAGLRRRSLVVHFWRGALPAVIAVAVVGLGAWAGIRTFAEMQPSQQSAGDIRMIGPEFHGRDKNGRAYTVTAQSAVRDPAHPERAALVEPHLVMDTLAHGQVVVAAHNGLYNETTKILNLSGAVTADTEKGEHFASATAKVDTVASHVEGHDGMQASSALGQTMASAYTIDDKDGRVLLTGNVHTHLVPHAGAK